jgi:PAS domain S-box-containing protein
MFIADMSIDLTTGTTNPSQANDSEPDQAGLADIILENVPLAIAIFDVELRLVRCNALYLDQLVIPKNLGQPGTAISEIFRANAELGMHGPGNVETHVSRLINEIQNHELKNFDCVRPDGRVVSVIVRPAPDGRLIMTCDNSVTHKQTEETLRHSHHQVTRELERAQSRFMDFALIGADWFWEMDKDLRFTWFSRRPTNMDEVDDKDIIGKTRAEYLGYDRTKEVWRNHERDLAARRPFYNLEYSVTDHQGDDSHVEISGKPFSDDDGVFAGYRGIGRNVTELKNAQNALHETQSLYRAIVEDQKELVSRFTPDGKFNFVNEAMCRFIGKPQDALIGTSVYEGIVEESHKDVDHLLSNLQANTSSLSNYSQRVRHDGEIRLIEWHDYAIGDTGGNIIEIQSVGRDITERHNAQQALVEKTMSLELLQRVATAVNEVQTVEEALKYGIDAICDFTHWPIGHAYLVEGVTENRLVPTNVWRLDDPEKFSEFRKFTEDFYFDIGSGLPGRVLSSGKAEWIGDVVRDEDFLRINSYDIGIRSGFGVPILANNNVAGVFEFYTGEMANREDVALDLMFYVGEIIGRVVERKLSEERLRYSEQQFKDYADTAADWFWEMGPDLKFTYFSGRVEEVTGIPASDFIGRSRNDILIVDQGKAAFSKHLEDLANHLPFSDFRYCYSAAEQVKHASTSGKPLFDAKGTFLGYRGSATDISAEVLALQSLREAKERAEFANRTKTAFLANMSHELRTPLNAIIGFSEIMISAALGKVENPIHLSYVNDISQAGTHLLEVINDILDVARIEAGEVEIYDDIIDIQLIGESCMKMVGARAFKADIGIVLDIPDNFPALRADRTRVRQTLLNLVINSVKFSNQGAQVTAAAALIDGAINITVSDTGIGIPEQDLQTIFEPFMQVHDVFTRPHEGSGLGLALVKSMMELHGGSVTIDSMPGEGTVVTLAFPSDRTVPNDDKNHST